MNPGAPPYRCIPGRPTTCNHATQAAVVARPHPSRAVRLRPTRLPPPGPPPRHETTPKPSKAMTLPGSTRAERCHPAAKAPLGRGSPTPPLPCLPPPVERHHRRPAPGRRRARHQAPRPAARSGPRHTLRAGVEGAPLPLCDFHCFFSPHFTDNPRGVQLVIH